MKFQPLVTPVNEKEYFDIQQKCKEIIEVSEDEINNRKKELVQQFKNLSTRTELQLNPKSIEARLQDANKLLSLLNAAIKIDVGVSLLDTSMFKEKFHKYLSNPDSLDGRTVEDYFKRINKQLNTLNQCFTSNPDTSNESNDDWSEYQ